MTKEQAIINTMANALLKIVQCNQKDLAAYCAEVDGIAINARIRYEQYLEDKHGR